MTGDRCTCNSQFLFNFQSAFEIISRSFLYIHSAIRCEFWICYDSRKLRLFLIETIVRLTSQCALLLSGVIIIRSRR